MAGRDSSSVSRSLPLFVGLTVLLGCGVVVLSPVVLSPLIIGALVVSAGVLMTLTFHGRGGRFVAEAWPCCLAAAITAGVVHGELSARWPSALAGERVIGALTIDSLIEGRGEALELEGLLLIESPRTFARTLRVKVRWSQPPRPLPRAGERWRLLLRLTPPSPRRNPGGFDTARQALAERWHAQAQVVPWSATQRISAAKPGLLQVREKIAAEIFERVVDRDAAALFAGLAVGATEAVSPEQWRVFSVTGTTHLVAISGMHVTLFAWIMAGFARGIWRLSAPLRQRVDREVFAGVLGVTAAFGYALLAGFGVPTQRTIVMLVIWWAMRLSGRVHSDYAVLGLALVAVWIIDPLAPLSAGFWLSFVAMATLMASAGQTAPHPVSSAEGECAPTKMTAFHSGWVRWIEATRELWRVQWRIGLALLPLTLAWFSTVSIAGLLVNLLAIPIFSFVLVPLVLLGSLLQSIARPLATPMWWLAEQVHALIWPPMHAIAQSEWASTSAAVPMVGLIAAMVAVAIGLFGSHPAHSRDIIPKKKTYRSGIRWSAIGVLLTVSVVSAVWSPPIPRGVAEVVLLDAGDATAVIVRTRSQTLVYDTAEVFGAAGGGARSRVIPALRELRAGPVDLLILGSTNTLRIVGAATLATLWPVKEIRFAAGWQAPPVGARPCDRALLWQRDEVEFQLHPVGESGQFCVLRVKPRQGPALLIAERLDRPSTSALAGEAPIWLQAEVIIAPRRGSLRALDPQFVQATRAQTLLIAARVFDPRQSVATARAWGVSPQQVRATAIEGALRLRLGSPGPLQIDGYLRRYRLGVWQATVD